MTDLFIGHIVCVTYYKTTSIDAQFETLKLELRRGCLSIAVLAELRKEHYGYALRRALAEQGLEIEEQTLYPLLRRLETQGLLESEWREEGKRNKRFYKLSAAGRELLSRLLEEWQSITSALDRVLEREPASA